MDNDRNDRIDPVTGAPHAGRPVGDRDGRNWLWWLIAAAIAITLLILLIRGCDDATDNGVVDDTAATAAAATTGERVSDAGDPMVPAAAYRTADFDAYLGGTEPVGRAFALDRVTFASGSDALDAAGRAEVAELAGVLERYPNAAVALTGYADPEGDAAANQALSQRRAQAVQAALVEAGAAAGRVTLAAAGETGDAAVRANRKVEVRVTAR